MGSSPRLFAARYNDKSYSGTAVPEENFDNPANLGIRWSLPGGIQRIELTVKATSKIDAYNRYRHHLGHRIAVYDNLIDRFIGGQVYEVQVDGQFVTYQCAGPWRRLFDQQYQVSNAADITYPTDDTDVVIKDIIDDTDNGITNADQSGIAATGKNIGGWTPAAQIGTNAGDAIQYLASAGSSAGNQLFFYLQDAPFDFLAMPKPLARLVEEGASKTTPDFTFSLADLAQNGATVGRNIWELANQVKIGWGRVTGTYTAVGSSSTTLTDSGAAFIADGVQANDTVVNITDGSIATVVSVDSATQITVQNFTGGTDNDFDTNDRYVIIMAGIQYDPGVISPSVGEYWSVVRTEQHPYFDETHAQDYRDLVIALYGDAVLQQAFTLSAPFITDSNGTLKALWRPLFEEKYIFRIADLFPQYTSFSTTDDRESVFYAKSIDYTYADNRLRIVPATQDTRLDAFIARSVLRELRFSAIVSTAQNPTPGRDRLRLGPPLARENPATGQRRY